VRVMSIGVVLRNLKKIEAAVYLCFIIKKL
jgi:hypothetical protein